MKLFVQHEVLNFFKCVIVAETLEICFYFCLRFICHKGTFFFKNNSKSVPSLNLPVLAGDNQSLYTWTAFLGQNLLLLAGCFLWASHWFSQHLLAYDSIDNVHWYHQGWYSRMFPDKSTLHWPHHISWPQLTFKQTCLHLLTHSRHRQ